MKQQQALIIVLSYVIGFSTAFIAFNLTDVQEKSNNAKNGPISNSSAETNHKIEKVVTDTKVKTMINNEGLFVVHDGKERIISAKANSSDDLGDGYHKDVSASMVSPDGSYVYYCAEAGSDDESCSCFIYSLADDAVYKIIIDGKQLVTSKKESLFVSWLPDNSLKISDQLVLSAPTWSGR